VMDECNNFDGPIVVFGAFCWVGPVVYPQHKVGPNLTWTFTIYLHFRS
jgi:hypothetical protein